MVLKSLTTEFSVIGANSRDKLFKFLDHLPRPGQWIYLESQSKGIDRFLAQVASVNISLIDTDLYRLSMEINRAAIKEDILFAKLARQQFDLIDRGSEILEALNFTETSEKEETFTITVLSILPGYSNVNYSNGEYSET